MATIEDLLGLDLSKIDKAPLKSAVEELLKDYKNEKEKDYFSKQAKENIDKLFSLVKTHAPLAVKKKPKPKEEKKEHCIEEEKEKKTDDKTDENNEKLLKELEKLEPKLEECRTAIRDYNKKKRDATGPRPKKNRYTKLKERLLSLVSLIPDNLKEDSKVLEETEEVLLLAHRRLVKNWGMNKLKAAPGARAITEKVDDLQEKISKEEEEV